MNTVQDLEELKERAGRMTAQRDRTQGALEQKEKELKDEFDVDSKEKAEALLKTMKKEEASEKEKYEKAREAFDEEWGDVLG